MGARASMGSDCFSFWLVWFGLVACLLDCSLGRWVGSFWFDLVWFGPLVGWLFLVCSSSFLFSLLSLLFLLFLLVVVVERVDSSY